MNTAIRLPLNAANPAVLKELQQKYPNAELHIVTDSLPGETSLMNEERFWEVIGLLDWSKEGKDDAVIEPAIRHLANMNVDSILSFADLLSEKLYLLDGKDYAECSIMEGESISADLFLYARCAIIANGRNFFEEVLVHPNTFPKDLFFEALMNVPHHAWLRSTGRNYTYVPKYNYETGFNPNGWGADTITL